MVIIFISLSLYIYEDITQLVEYETFNFGVESSNLSILTKFHKGTYSNILIIRFIFFGCIENSLLCLVYGPVVKRLRHRSFTAVSRVRIPAGSPLTFSKKNVIIFL